MFISKFLIVKIMKYVDHIGQNRLKWASFIFQNQFFFIFFQFSYEYMLFGLIVSVDVFEKLSFWLHYGDRFANQRPNRWLLLPWYIQTFFNSESSVEFNRLTLWQILTLIWCLLMILSLLETFSVFYEPQSLKSSDDASKHLTFVKEILNSRQKSRETFKRTNN